MSFDTEFNYSSVLTSLNGHITSLNDERNQANTKLAIIGNLNSKYQHLGTSEVEYYTTLNNKLNKDISNFGNLVNEVISVQSLQSDTKNTIYDFYTTYVENRLQDKVLWMRSMIYNINDGLIEDVGNLMADGNITSTEANTVADLICRTYQPKRQTMGFTKILTQEFI